MLELSAALGNHTRPRALIDGSIDRIVGLDEVFHPSVLV